VCKCGRLSCVSHKHYCRIFYARFFIFSSLTNWPGYSLFQSLRSLGLKLTILQAFKVVLFYLHKWSGEWVEFNPKWPSRDVTLLSWVYLRCRISCWQVREYVRRHVQRFRNKQISRISADFRPCQSGPPPELAIWFPALWLANANQNIA